MAKKNEGVGLLETLAEFKDLKKIDSETLIQVLEDSFRAVLIKMFGSDENYDVIVNAEVGDCEIWRTRMVVDDGAVADANLEVGLTQAREMDAEAEIGDDVTDSVDFASFGRRAILGLRQALSSKILDLQKQCFYDHFSERIGRLVSAEVYQVWKREALLIDDDGNELILPKNEQIPGDFFRKGDTVLSVIHNVTNDNNNPKVILSRTSPEFLKRLFELNVPEIADGLIMIKKVARIPGERAKMAVESYDERIDPVGSCVGMNGSRIRGIVRELKGENIDVMSYTANASLLIQRSLSPAKTSRVVLNDEEQRADVYVAPEEVRLAIGKSASNIKLASALSGYSIEVFRDIEEDAEDDIYLTEFLDEFDTWVVDTLHTHGYMTARDVLKDDIERVVQKTDLEVKTVKHLMEVLASEFSTQEIQEMNLPQSNTSVIAQTSNEESVEEQSAAEENE